MGLSSYVTKQIKLDVKRAEHKQALLERLEVAQEELEASLNEEYARSSGVVVFEKSDIKVIQDLLKQCEALIK